MDSLNHDIAALVSDVIHMLGLGKLQFSEILLTARWCLTLSFIISSDWRE